MEAENKKSISKRKLIIIISATVLIIAIVLGILLPFGLANLAEKRDRQKLVQTPSYKGIDLPVLQSTAETGTFSDLSDESYIDAESAPLLLNNPDRGLRMEVYMTLGPNLRAYPGGSGEVLNPYDEVRRFVAKYVDDSPRVTQFYVYLCDYKDKPLDDLAIRQFEDMLKLFSELNIRALLRFAYQNEANDDPENWSTVEGHLARFDAWFKDNPEVVENTIMAMQCGVLGYWGEGHTMNNLKDKKYIGRAFDRIFAMAPEDMFVQVRNIDLAQYIGKQYKDNNRLSAHDDYIIGDVCGAWSWYNGRRDEEALEWEAYFKNTLNDAEMPWGRSTMYDIPGAEPLNAMPYHEILKQVAQYSLTTFSLEHNYLDDGVNTLARWKNEYISTEFLSERDYPYLPSLFVDGEISVFDYLNYHLGYLLSFHSVELNRDSRTVSVMVQNMGCQSFQL